MTDSLRVPRTLQREVDALMLDVLESPDTPAALYHMHGHLDEAILEEAWRRSCRKVMRALGVPRD